MTEQFKNQY